MPPLHSSTLKTVLVAAVIFGAGVIVATVNYRVRRAHLVTDLTHDARTAAVAFDEAELEPLLEGGRDADVLAGVRRRLQRLEAADPHVHAAYLLVARRSSGRISLVADAAGDGPETRPQVAFPEEPPPGLAALVAGEPGGISGPREDEAGEWVTGYARITERDDRVLALAVDVAAAEWRRELGLAAFRGALYAWVLLGIPVFAFLTTRRQGEQREAIRNLSEAVEQSHSAILILDLQQRIEYANRGLCQQLGYSRRELLGRHCRDFLTGPGSTDTISDLLATIRSGQTWEGEWTNLRQDGSAYPVRGMVSPVKHRDGSMACFVAIFDDVTEAKRKEAELRDARDLAEAGDRAKGQFLATMSHEVRTPLNGIVGFTSLLLDTPLSPEQREFVQTIRASGEALIQLTGDILDYARIESGKLKLDPTAADPRECMEEALDLHATKAAEKEIELLHHAADDVPAAVVVDGGRLRQVLVNLIGNAVKFTERGEVEVTVRARDGAGATAATATAVAGTAPAPHGWCRLEFTIRDTGIGIAPGQHGRLFKPFSQIDESSTRRYGGAGLGLAISKNLVHLMGGEISVASAPGQGTIFTFTIHVPVAAPQPPARHLDGLAVALAIPAGSRRRELAGLLASWGATVSEADDAAGLAAGAWDVALVDVGETAAREIAGRSRPSSSLPPEKTLALVPISLPAELRAGLRAHFRLLLNLPLHHGPLFALLSGARAAAPAAAGPAIHFGFRVLVVEDNAVNRRLVQRVLTTLGCTWHAVTNGREALAELEQRADAYDIVLLDLHMPELDGLSALERVRRGEAGPRAQTLWVIALTADVRPEQRTRGFALGLNDYLTKPLRVAELEAAFQRYRADRVGRH